MLQGRCVPAASSTCRRGTDFSLTYSAHSERVLCAGDRRDLSRRSHTLSCRGAVVRCPQPSSLLGFYFAHTRYRTQLHDGQKSVVSCVQPGLVFTDAHGIEKRLHSSQVLVLPEPAIETNERECACFTPRSPLLVNLLQQLLLRRSSIHRSPGACARHKRPALLFHSDTWTRA